MADDRLQTAIDVIAHRVLAHAAEDALDFDHVGWENYPEIGEHDWGAIEQRVHHFATVQRPSDEAFAAAYEYLTGRATDTERRQG